MSMKEQTAAFSAILALAVSSAAWGGGFAGLNERIKFRTYQTVGEPGGEMREIRTTPFTRHAYVGKPVLDLDDLEASHKFFGLGVSFTDASCWLLSQLPPERRHALLAELFTPQGVGLSVGRLNIGASDYATELYNYNDEPGDVEMKHFSVARDEVYMIPVLKEAAAICPNLFYFASPWSPPGWMKTTGEMCGGALKDDSLEALSNYLLAYLKAYRDRGIRVQALTIQNEPDTDQHGGCPATIVSGEQEAKVTGRLLGPKIAAEGLGTKIWLWDHDVTTTKLARVGRVLEDPAVRKVTRTVAVHPYTGSATNLQAFVRAHPGVELHMTECGPNVGSADGNEVGCLNSVFSYLENGCSSYLGWNLCLDADGQPCTGHFHCAGLVEVDIEKGTWKPSGQYRAFRHIGPFVKRGAEIMRTKPAIFSCTSCVFRNPDGQLVVVLAQKRENRWRTRVYLKYRGEYLALALPFDCASLTTVVIDP